MKLEISAKHFRNALSRMASIPGAHSASVFTQAVRLTADIQGLTLVRFTAEARISILVEEVKIEDEGEPVSVNHGSIANLISGMTGKDIAIHTDDKKIYFASGRAKSSLALFSEEAEAEPPEFELETEHIRLPIEDLARLFNFVSPAIGNDMAGRPMFCGVCIRMMLGRLAFIATDGRRCHVALEDYALPVDCIVSSTGVDAILKAIGSEAGACTLAIGENTISVNGSNVELSLALVNERFPNIEGFITQPESSIISKVGVNRDELIEVLKSCASIGEDSKMVSLEIEESKMTVFATNKRDSEMSATIECSATASVTLHGPAMQIATALGLMQVDDDGSIEILHYLGNVSIKQADRITFVALQKPKTE